MRPVGSFSGSREGFTLVELLLAILLLTIIGVGLVGATQYAERMMDRSRAELGAAEFIQLEMERLNVLPWDSVVSGERTTPNGLARWTVVDSTSFKEVTLVTRHHSPKGFPVVDTLMLYRIQ